ncbi:MAG: hypothetical protein HY831_01790 [Candidatus Aenigmarchaeota archaeon]|nr:hypothetical protein [Candidatus Aenigmarchaeota archaeon]
MTKKLLTIRDVDDETFTKFKSRAVQEKMKMGDALEEAMSIWLKEKEYKNKPSIKRFLKFRSKQNI